MRKIERDRESERAREVRCVCVCVCDCVCEREGSVHTEEPPTWMSTWPAPGCGTGMSVAPTQTNESVLLQWPTT